MVDLKAVIRDEEHMSVPADQRQVATEQQVHELVRAVHHVAVHLEISGGDVRHARSAGMQERGGEPLDQVEVHGEQVPRLVLDDPGRRAVDGRGAGERRRQERQTMVSFLIDTPGLWDEGQHLLGRDLAGVQANIRQGLYQLRVRDRMREDGPRVEVRAWPRRRHRSRPDGRTRSRDE